MAFVAEQGVDVGVPGGRAGAVEVQVVPVADARQQLEPEQRGEPEHRQRLALGVGVDGVRLDVGLVAQQPIDDVDGFPRPALHEMTEQRDVGVGHEPHRQPAIAAVADVGLGEQVVLPGVDLRAVDGDDLPVAPHPGHVQGGERVDHVGRAPVYLVGGGVLVARGVELVGGDLAAHVPGHLGRAEVRAVGVGGEHVPAQNVAADLRVRPGRRPQVPRPPGQIGGAGEDVEQAALGQPLVHRLLQCQRGRAPTSVSACRCSPNHVAVDVDLVLQSENGILAVGPYPWSGEEDSDLINAGKETVTVRRGASSLTPPHPSGWSRGGKIDTAILGAMQVSVVGTSPTG